MAISNSDPVDAVYRWEPAQGTDGERLRYSLRSIQRKAPWIRKVYVVTGGEPPVWIGRGNERLSVVRHEELFRDRSVLPTSNPLAVEWQLHRIPGLSRRFLYMTDDCFLGRPVMLEDFLTSKGGYRVFVQTVDIAPADAALVFTEGLLNGRFGNRSPRKKTAHAPRLFDRDFLEEVDRLWGKQVKQTAGHRAPHPEDVSMETLYCYYLLECPHQKGTHEAVTIGASRKDYVSAEIASFGGAMALLPGLAVSRPKFLYLNYDARAALVRTSARAFLKTMYLRRSSFEN